MFRLVFGILCFSNFVFAQNFSSNFENKTLRVDYIFAGDALNQTAYLHQLTSLNQWQGRIQNLDSNFVQGNGQIRMYNIKNNRLIYSLPFSTLFQEWLLQEQAKKTSKSFENSFLLPFPKEKVRIDVVFLNTDKSEKVISSQIIDPNDVLIAKTTNKKQTPFVVLHKAKKKKSIKVAIVAEGYTQKEQNLFIKKAKEVIKELFKHKVFKKYQTYFNIVAVSLVSEQSGVSVPSKNQWVSSAVGSHFDTFYSSRYLTTSKVFSLHQKLENVPYQHLIILANTWVYGGGGILNSYTLTTANHQKFAPVVVHEFGHSFAGLADEYFYKDDVLTTWNSSKEEPWEQNITSLKNFDSKWKFMVESKTPIPTPNTEKDKILVGAFEGLKGNGLYIPSHHCRMKTNDAEDFCAVCSLAIEKAILYYTQN